MLKIFLNKDRLHIDDLKYICEILWIVPYLNDIAFQKINSDIMDTGMYSKLFFNKDILFKDASLQECDYSILPFKYNPSDQRIIAICSDAAMYDKKVLAMYNDDIHRKFDLPNNLILFRTSVSRSDITDQERVFPVPICDHFSGNYECQDSIGFCGCPYFPNSDGSLNYLRKHTIENIRKYYPTDVIFRYGYAAPELPKFIARRDYYKNLSNNKFTLCIRGAGNFSYRFYETLMYGRIPIVLDTNTILPLSNIIDWDKHIIFITDKDISNISDIIKSKNINLMENRKLWEDYLSPHGFIKNIKKFI